MENKDKFTFEISLSVLNHLGRNLYRSFATVLGEAISNAWDADAHNVWVYINKEKSTFIIKDDGDGMTSDDFQNKFLKIGYSKRKNGVKVSSEGRPYIGRKGIGKLALLSCAASVLVISKIKDGGYVGGSIDNSDLDDAIEEDLVPSQYPLGGFDLEKFSNFIKEHEKGTIIVFEGVKEGISNRLEYLKEIIALYFRFSLLDDSFNIFLNDEQVTLDNLKDFAESTEFLWNINDMDDPYIKEKVAKLKEPIKNIAMAGNVKGFIASVEKPSNLKIRTTDEKVSIDLFVNGRLREKDILKHIPTDRLAADYLYGQIHVNELDDDEDRFTSSREGMVAEDQKFKAFLENLKAKLSGILEDWDKWRIKHKKEGDSESTRITRKERSSRGLFNAVSGEYSDAVCSKGAKEGEKDECKGKVNEWVDSLADDAQFNFTSYAECFISENLVRKHIEENKIALSKEANEEIDKRKKNEEQHKNKGNISIDLRKTPSNTQYLAMDYLANLVDKRDPVKEACLSRDANEYKPIRDALMHTSLLTDEAKKKLSSVYENIKGRITTLLSKKN